MPYQPYDEKTLGLFSDGPLLRAAFIVSTKGRPVIQQLFEIPCEDSKSVEIVKPLYIPENDLPNKELKQLISSHLAVSGLSSSDLLVRRLRLKLTKESDVEEAFPFQTEALLPYPLESAIIDKVIVEKKDGSTLLTFLAAKKDSVLKHLEFWQERGIDPEVVSAEPIALCAFISQFSQMDITQFIVHMGYSATLCLLLREGKLISSHSIPKGWESLHHAIHEDLLGQELTSLDSETYNQEKNPHLKQASEDLVKAIEWNFLAQMKETKLKELPFLYLMGEGGNIPYLLDLLEKTLGLPIGEFKNFNLAVSLVQLKAFAMPIGLALTAQPYFHSPVNFRRQNLSFTNPWKRFKKQLLLYGGLVLLLTISLYLFGISYLQYREDALKMRYLALLSLVQKPYDQFEKQYETKYLPGSENLTPIANLNADGLDLRLDYLEKEIRAMPDTFPLFPHIPRVSDVLAWISTHPVLTCKEENKDSEECPSFTIDAFHYTMMKRPELNKKSEKYQVKIDLEFTTSSPRVAREFHDALIAPNPFVDPKAEIKWNATKGKYLTSFYLKDQTTYLSPLKE